MLNMSADLFIFSRAFCFSGGVCRGHYYSPRATYTFEKIVFSLCIVWASNALFPGGSLSKIEHLQCFVGFLQVLAMIGKQQTASKICGFSDMCVVANKYLLIYLLWRMK